MDKTIEKLFERDDVGNDTKHKLNLENKTVSRDLLKKIEAGVDIEELEKIELPVCKYKTQITIHGLFPDQESNGYVYGYKHVFQNKNRSIGIRYGAIDAQKKKVVSDIWRTAKNAKLTKWHINRSSQEFTLNQFSRVTSKEEAVSQSIQFKDFFSTVPKDLFIGHYGVCFVKDIYGQMYLEASVELSSIRWSEVNYFCELFFSVSLEQAKELDKIAELKEIELKKQRDIEVNNAQENAQKKFEALKEKYKNDFISVPKEGIFRGFRISYGEVGFCMFKSIILKNGKSLVFRIKSPDEVPNVRSSKRLVDPTRLNDYTLIRYKEAANG